LSKLLEVGRIVNGWLKEMGPKIVFDNFASGNEVRDECPPANDQVLEVIATCP